MRDVKNKTERFLELEGLRGLAAVSVVLHHSILAFFTAALFGTAGAVAAVQHSRLEAIAYGNPLMFLLSGTFSVAIFFVLSGFVLSVGFFQTGRDDIVRSLAIRRYPRLMIPALVSTALCAFCIALGFSRVQEVLNITGSGWLMGTWSTPFSFFDVFRSGAIDIFVQTGSPFNTVLWTMMTEFTGSFLVFMLLLVLGKSKYRYWAYVLLALVMSQTWYLAFIIGMFLADIYTHKQYSKYKNTAFLTVFLTGAAIWFGGYPMGRIEGFWYGWMQLLPPWAVPSRNLSLILGATAIVIVALWSKIPKKILSTKAVSCMGKYTFALYLVHIPVLYTLTYWLFLKFHTQLGYTFAACISIAITLPVYAGAAYLFEKYIDAPAIRFAAWFSNVFLGKEKLSISRDLLRAYRRVARFIRRNFIGEHGGTKREQLPGALETDEEAI